MKTSRHEASTHICSVMQMHPRQINTHAVKTRCSGHNEEECWKSCAIFLACIISIRIMVTQQSEEKKYTIVLRTDSIVKLEFGGDNDGMTGPMTDQDREDLA